MKPFFEQVRPLTNRSYYLREKHAPFMTMPFHYHPELELTLNVGNHGKRFIGNSVERLDDFDLVFIGPNLPHAFISDTEFEHSQEIKKASSIVLQFNFEMFGDAFLQLPEMDILHLLLEKGKHGMWIGGETKKRIADKMTALLESSEIPSLLIILDILHELSKTKDYRLLSSKGFIKEYHAPDFHRLNVVYDYIVKNFREDISLGDAAEVANMSETAFCRFLKKRTLKTFVQIITEMRVGYACSLLKKDIYNVKTIAEEAGFKNLSNFNRKFKKITGNTPFGL
ncbi:AraC family transcriptional regulator [Flagellimonas sp. CMM7]|uniref:AraC family transcriptional regulator n=1 Tax=Flagellimonas sp. CMM7 TaxID=2654676 RepID=UPI0013D106C6|nr:AraC family transcriptional regulator [Flagellimonas sp. CMM7]UII80293.1 AraC family transcriptional regulator [Flagellimonas sp. CMM7]